MRLNLRRSLKVLDVYNICYVSDVVENYEILNQGNQVPFKRYRPFYREVEELGLEMIDPATLDYPGVDGDCVQFFLKMMKLPSMSTEKVKNLTYNIPQVKVPGEGDIVLYHWSTLAQSFAFNPSHIGIFKKGKVLSKFGNGPIFRHGLHDVPYNSTMWSPGKPEDFITFHGFNL
jgi:hypothetical protein